MNKSPYIFYDSVIVASRKANIIFQSLSSNWTVSAEFLKFGFDLLRKITYITILHCWVGDALTKVPQLV